MLRSLVNWLVFEKGIRSITHRTFLTMVTHNHVIMYYTQASIFIHVHKLMYLENTILGKNSTSTLAEQLGLSER